MRDRLLLAVPGMGLLLYGAFRLLTEQSLGNLVALALWLVAAVVVHDGLVAPFTVGVGVGLARWVPPLARRHLQATLTVGGLIVVVAVPLLLRRGSQPAAKAQVAQDYPANLALLLALVAVVGMAAYAGNVLRDRRRPTVSGGDESTDAAAESRPG